MKAKLRKCELCGHHLFRLEDIGLATYAVCDGCGSVHAIYHNKVI